MNTNTITAARAELGERTLALTDALAKGPVDESAHRDVLDRIRGGNLTLRDTLLMAAFTDPAPRRELIDFAIDPHKPESSRFVHDTLFGMFRDAAANPPLARMTAIADNLETLAGEEHGRAAAQLHATAAYLYWMTGDEEQAAAGAVAALGDDRGNTMADIVLTAIARGMKPAYLH